MAIDAHGVVARWKLCAPRRRHRIILASVARREIGLARFGRLQQGDTKFPLRGGNLLSLWSQLRNPAVGRVDNQRRAGADALHGQEHRVVGAGDVGIGPALQTPVAVEHCRARSV